MKLKNLSQNMMGEFPDRYFNEIMRYLKIDPNFFKNKLCDRFRSPHLWKN